METKAALAALSGLSQASRLAIFRLLVEIGHGGLPAGKIAARLEIPSTTLSFHLKNMHQAGLVVPKREGTTIQYSANFEAMTALVSYLTANCCGGDMSACSPARATKRGRKARGSSQSTKTGAAK